MDASFVVESLMSAVWRAVVVFRQTTSGGLCSSFHIHTMSGVFGCLLCGGVGVCALVVWRKEA